MSKRKRILLVCTLAAALVAAAGAAVLVGLTAVERDALHLAESGQEAMRFFGSYAGALKHGDLPALAALYHPDASAPQGLWREEPAVERDGVRVSQLTAVPLPGLRLASRGGGGGREALDAWLGDLVGGLGHLEKAKLKLARVESAEDDRMTVRTVVWLRGERPRAASPAATRPAATRPAGYGGSEAGSGSEAAASAESRIADSGIERYETLARLRLEMVRVAEPDGELTWRIRRQELIDGTTVTGPGTGFAEVAVASGLDFRARHNPAFATAEWFPHKFGVIPYGGAGLSAADYDGDGWDDLFFADGAEARLYRNRGDGTFADTTAAAGLPVPLAGVNVAIFADLDNDGDKDLFLGVFTGPNRLYRNEGDGTFSDVTAGAGLGGEMATVASAADYDRDGLLDLYVGRYLDPRTELPDTMFYSRNGEGNRLLRNVGDLRFADVTETSGTGDTGLALGVAWADYDGDGFDDLYVANDYGRNALLRNRGDGTFEDVTAESGTLDFGFGMSAAWGDVDNDGRFDLYVSNIHSGQRWYGQAPSLKVYLLNSIRQGTIRQDLPLYREIYGYLGPRWQSYGDGMVKGNSLLINRGDGGFTDVAEAANANPFGWYWGSGFLDFDHDGRLDVFAANGWITATSEHDL